VDGALFVGRAMIETAEGTRDVTPAQRFEGDGTPMGRFAAT